MAYSSEIWHDAADSALSAKTGKIDPEALNEQSRKLFDNLTVGELEEMMHLTVTPPGLS